MNLLDGQIVDTRQAAKRMQSLAQSIGVTLQKPLLNPMLVVDACDALVHALKDSTVLSILAELGFSEAQGKAQLLNIKTMFSRDYLLHRLEAELGSAYGAPQTRIPYAMEQEVTEQIVPLGVLFHIAAGNMDGLPVFSVIEGLLAGNINLLKLPQVDGGLSVQLLKQLVDIEPRLTEYIYVFELSSKETESLMQLAHLADAVVVWGGDEAVQSVRQMAPPNTRVIEWGHKLSFAYVTQQGMDTAKLEGLAHNICGTNQLLCSSCQGIFVDTESGQVARDFCTQFLPILDKVSAEYPAIPLSAKAQSTLRLYTNEIETALGVGVQVFRGENTSLTFKTDRALDVSMQFQNPWVRCLPRKNLIPQLHPHKNHLQTAALLCGDDEWKVLRNMLWRAGVVRISSGADMSETYCGAAHDGDYPLRRYTRVVSAQR